MTELGQAEFSLAVFAHNVEATIRPCIESILTFAGDRECRIFVLANGCTDTTEAVVREMALVNPTLHLVSLSPADKSNAWNHYVYELAPEGVAHFFVDGDVRLLPGALAQMTAALDLHPEATAIAGVPGVGRDRDAWIRRMKEYGRVSGGLYALRDEFLQQLRANGIAMPIGFIGDDFLVSALAKDMPGPQGIYTPSPRLWVETGAAFVFRSLSPLRLSDYRTYLRRLVRYRMRDYQLSALLHLVGQRGFPGMPGHAAELHTPAGFQPRYHWRGRQTLVDWLAVRRIRTETRKYLESVAERR